jgi:hypothetical protein
MGLFPKFKTFKSVFRGRSDAVDRLHKSIKMSLRFKSYLS